MRVQPVLVCFLLCLGLRSVAQQGTLSGKVTDSSTGAPVPFASVFLSNASKGTRTTDDGSFTLSGVKPGRYDLVVSSIGYSPATVQVSVENGSQVLPTMTITPKVTQLREVRIGNDAEWKANYELFKREFLGETENALQCSITNPDALDLSFNRKTRELQASSDGFLDVENRALGYRVRFLLRDLTKQYNTGMLYYEGSVLFEELKGSENQQKKWKKKREEVFRGSTMDFYRSLKNDQLTENDFEMRRLVRVENPNRPPDSLINAQIGRFLHSARTDSLRYWAEIRRRPKILQQLAKIPYKRADLMIPVSEPGLFAITYPDYLYVSYKGKKVALHNPTNYPLSESTRYPSSVLILSAKYIIFDSNGVVINPRSVVYEGDWQDRVGDMLPVDYEPG